MESVFPGTGTTKEGVFEYSENRRERRHHLTVESRMKECKADSVVHVEIVVQADQAVGKDIAARDLSVGSGGIWNAR